MTPTRESLDPGLPSEEQAARMWSGIRAGTEVERLRRQNHEAAQRRDRQTAALQAEVDRWHNVAARARELVRGSPVDWTNHPPSQGPGGWWGYTSQNNRDVLMAAIAAERGRLRLRALLLGIALGAAVLLAWTWFR